MTARAPLLLICSLASCGGGAEVASVPRPETARLADLDRALVEAIEAGVAAVEAAPQEAAAWMALGMTYEAHSQHDLALPCYAAAVARDRAAPRAWYRLGLARAKAGDLPGAVAALERVQQLEPSYTAARLRLGFLELDAGDLDAARRAFEAAGDAPAAQQGLAQADLEQGRPGAALVRLEDADLLEGGNRALTQRLRGLALARLGREGEAEQALADGTAAKPVIADPWSREVNQYKVGSSALLMRAQKMIDRRKVPGALELLEPLRSDGDPRVLRLLGSAYARLNRFPDSAEVLGEAARLEPDEPAVALAWASALSQCLRNTEATLALEDFLERHPAHPDLWAGLQGLAVVTGDHARAVGVRGRARSAGQESSVLEVGAGESELALGRFAAAAASFTRAIELDDAQTDAWLGRASARLELDRPAEAAEDVAQAEARGADAARLAPLKARLEEEDA